MAPSGVRVNKRYGPSPFSASTFFMTCPLFLSLYLLKYPLHLALLTSTIFKLTVLHFRDSHSDVNDSIRSDLRALDSISVFTLDRIESAFIRSKSNRIECSRSLEIVDRIESSFEI
jgi:hypothetical protein